MRDLEELFAALARSKFRSRFRLGSREQQMLADQGPDAILRQGGEFLTQRLQPADPKNDGKQTPMHGHPVFLAQHATATCCRECLRKWHRIPLHRELSEEEMDYALVVIARWLNTQPRVSPRQQSLWPDQPPEP